MGTQQENYFDDSIRRKLNSAEEEVPFAFDDIATKLDSNSNDYIAWIRGFLFSDIILLLIAFSFIKLTNIPTSVSGSHAPINANKTSVVEVSASAINTTVSNSTSTTVIPVSFDSKTSIESASVSATANSNEKNLKTASIYKNKISSSHKSNSRLHRSTPLKNNSLLTFVPTTDGNTINTEIFASSNDFIAMMKLIGFKEDAQAENFIQTQENPAGSYTPPASILFYVSASPSSLSSINVDNNLNSKVKNSATNFSAGIQLRYTLGKHVSLLTGFEFKRGQLTTSLHDNYKYDAMQIDSTIGFIISPFDPPVMVIDYDTSFVSKTGIVSVDGEVRLSSFMFPAKVAYAWPLGSWTIEPNGGVLASFNAAKNTITHNYSGEPVDYYSEKFAFADLTYALTAGLNVSYLLSPKLKLFISTNYLKWMNASASYKNASYYAAPQFNGAIGIELKIK